MRVRLALALLFAAGLSVAAAQTVNSPITLNNPADISSLGAAPSNAHYYANQAESGLSAEVVPSANVITLLGSADNAAMRTNLGLVIGTNVQAFDADLTTYAGITPSANAQTLLGHTFVQMLSDIAAQAADSDLTTWAGITPAAGVGTFLATPSSANLNAALTDDVPTLAGANTFTVNGALSAPGASLNGTWITGGSSTTTKPYVLVEPTGTTSTGWSTNGTGLGVNAPSGFTGNILDTLLAGAQRFSITSTGATQSAAGYFIGASATNGNWTPTLLAIRSDAVLKWSSTTVATATADTQIYRDGAAATLGLGLADAAAPVAQTINVQDVVAGTSNTAGATLTINGSRGTGTGAGGNIVLGTALPATSASTQNATAAALTVNSVAQAPQVNTSTVANLTTCGASQEGAIRGVTDALAPAFLTALTGGGTVHAPVYCNGTAWVAF